MLKEFNLSYWLDKFQNKRNRTKNVLFGAFSLVGSQGAGSVIGMLITAVIVRSFSAEEFLYAEWKSADLSSAPDECISW